MHAWELVHKWKVKGVTIKTNNSIWLSAIILLMLNKQHRNETTYDLLMVHDAVCVDDEPHRLTLAALGNRDIGKININNDKASMSNGKLVKVVFEPLILIEDKVEGVLPHLKQRQVQAVSVWSQLAQRRQAGRHSSALR